MRRISKTACLGVLFFILNITLMGFSAPGFDEDKDPVNVEAILQNGSFSEKILAIGELASGSLEIEALVQVLKPFVKSDDIRIKLKAIKVLYNSGDKGAVDLLFSELKRGDVSVNIKLRIVDMLVSLNESELFRRLLSVLEVEQDRDVLFRILKEFFYQTSFFAVDKKYQDMFVQYLKDGTEEEKVAVINVLATNGVPALTLLEPVFQEESPVVLDAFFKALVNVGGVFSKKLLWEYINDSYSYKKISAYYALAILGEKSARMKVDGFLINGDLSQRQMMLDYLLNKVGDSSEKIFKNTINRLARNDKNEKIKLKAAKYMEALKQRRGFIGVD